MLDYADQRFIIQDLISALDYRLSERRAFHGEYTGRAERIKHVNKAVSIGNADGFEEGVRSTPRTPCPVLVPSQKCHI